MAKIRFLLLIALLARASWVLAAPVERAPGEQASVLLTRIGPAKSSLAHPPIETKAWDVADPAILGFYATPKEIDGEIGREIDGIVLKPLGAGKYEKIIIDHFGVEGGDPKIETVFFSAVGTNPAKRLFIIVSWPVQHANVNGTLYATYVYEPPEKSGAKRLAYLESLSNQLSGGCDCVRTDEPSTKAVFKNAAAVRAAIQKMK